MGQEEHRRSGFLEKLANLEPASATTAQLDAVEAVLDLYSERGLLVEGRAEPLYCVCPLALDCWGAPSDVPRPPPEQAEASVPWVGRDFPRGRVCAVAINHNRYGGIGANWWVVRGHIHERLGRGKRTLFPFRVGQYLAAVLCSAGGTTPAERELVPEAAAQAWESSAFLEAVKCSPAWRRGTPTRTMVANCPPEYLRAELELLRPSRIVGVGAVARAGLEAAIPLEVTDSRSGLVRAVGTLAGVEVEAFLMGHPSYGNWRRSLNSLLESLERDPARPL